MKATAATHFLEYSRRFFRGERPHVQKGMTQTQVSGVSGQISLSDAERGAPANLEGVRGLKLEQVLLLSTTLLVVLIAGLGGWATAVNTQRQFTDTAQLYRTRFEEQTRELGATVTHTLSLASSASLRDNNYSFITETVHAVLTNNPNVVRVRVLDAEGYTVADTDPKHVVGAQDKRSHVRSWATATYGAKLVFEYQEPIDYGSSAGQGLVILGYSLDTLQQELTELERNKAQALQANTVRTVVLGVFFVVASALFAAFQSRRISRPLAALTLQAQQLGEGDLEARVNTSHVSGREVSTLSVVFNHMADRIQWLMEDVKQKAVLEREMQLARTVQETLLPSRDVVVAGPLRIAGVCMPADACGGDWWLRAAMDDTRVVIGLGDVTGHGLSTALVATSATSGLAAALKMRDPRAVDAGLLMASLNQTLHLVGRGEYQMSAAIALFHVDANELEYSSGAHPAPVVYNRQEQKIGSLTVRGALLGASPATKFIAVRAPLYPGDVYVWYSDGLTEAQNSQNMIYGLKRLAAVIQRNGHLPAETLRDAIVADVRQHTGNIPQNDDITLIVAEYEPPS